MPRSRWGTGEGDEEGRGGEGRGRWRSGGRGGLPLTPQLTNAAAEGWREEKLTKMLQKEDMTCMGQIDEDRVWKKRKSC